MLITWLSSDEQKAAVLNGYKSFEKGALSNLMLSSGFLTGTGCCGNNRCCMGNALEVEDRCGFHLLRPWMFSGVASVWLQELESNCCSAVVILLVNPSDALYRPSISYTIPPFTSFQWSNLNFPDCRSPRSAIFFVFDRVRLHKVWDTLDFLLIAPSRALRAKRV